MPMTMLERTAAVLALSSFPFLLQGCSEAIANNKTVLLGFPDIKGLTSKDIDLPNLSRDQKAALLVRQSFMNASGQNAIFDLEIGQSPSENSSLNKQKSFYSIIAQDLGVKEDVVKEAVGEKNITPLFQIAGKNSISNFVGISIDVDDPESGEKSLIFIFADVPNPNNPNERIWSEVGFVESDIIGTEPGRYYIDSYRFALEGLNTPIKTMIYPIGPQEYGSIKFILKNGSPVMEIEGEQIAFEPRIGLMTDGGWIFSPEVGDPVSTAVSNPIETPLPPSTSIPSTETPLPPELKVAPEVKAQLDNQNADYKVNESGEAVITVAGKEITLTGLVDTKTDFGLAEDILNGYDKETNDWYLYTEKGGWAKVIEPGTPEIRTVVQYEDFGSGLVNASAALQYQKNPTIPAGAIDPQWWLQAGGNSAGRIVRLELMPIDNSKLIYFDGKTKPYGDMTLWLEFSKNGQDFVTAVQPNKNPDKDNKKPYQKIFMNWTFDKGRFDQKGPNVDDLTDYIVKGKVSLRALLVPDASRPSSIYTYQQLLAGPDNIFSTPDLLTPGAQISLFTDSEQAELEADLQILDLGNEIPYNQKDIPVSVIPQKLALQPLIGYYGAFKWGNFKP